MNYISFKAGSFIYSVELNEESYPQRQIIEDSLGQIKVSSLENCLSERVIYPDESLHKIISKEDFEKLWNESHKPYQKDWEKIKEHYPIGKKVEVSVETFYPQGIICKNDTARFITEDLSFVAEDEFLYPDEVLQGEVMGYDEENMWVRFYNNEKNISL